MSEIVKLEEPLRKAQPEGPYQVTKWHGMARFECELCFFDTLEEAKMLEHLRKKHAVKSKTEKEPVEEGATGEKDDVIKPEEKDLVGVYEIEVEEIKDDSKNSINQDDAAG